MKRKIRLLTGMILLIGGLLVPALNYNSPHIVIYIIASLPFITKGFLELIRFSGHKGINSLENILLGKIKFVWLVLVTFSLFAIVYIALTVIPLVVSNIGLINSLKVYSFTQIISAFIICVFSVLIIIDYLVIHSKKFATQEQIRLSGKEGEDRVAKELDAFCKKHSSYKYYHSLLLKYQEFDFLLIGENGIFNIEVKNYSGQDTTISLDNQGTWYKEKHGTKTEIKNPAAQVTRHHQVLQSVFGERFPVLDILLLANENNKLVGEKNSNLTIVKLNSLQKFIETHAGNKKLSSSDIKHLNELVKSNKQASRNSNY
jgi:hypothetical protein